MGGDNWDDDAPPRSARREGDPRSGSGSGRPGGARDGRTPSRPRRDDLDEPRRPRRDEPDDSRGASRPRRDEPDDRGRREAYDEAPRRQRSRDDADDSRGGSRGRRDEFDEPRRARGRDEFDEAPRRSRSRDDLDEPPRRSRRDEYDEQPRRSRRDEYDEPRRPRSRRSGYDDDENIGHRMMNVLTGRARAVRPGMPGAAVSAPPAKGGNFVMPILLLVLVAWLAGAGAGYIQTKPGPAQTSDTPPVTTGTPSLTPQTSPSVTTTPTK